MRKPVYLAVLGISIVVAAASLGVTLTRYLGLLAYSPKGTAQAAAAAAGPNVPATPPEQWNNLFAPGDGMKMASRLPAMDAKSRLPGDAHQFRPRGDDRILHPFRPPGDPLGERDEGAEGVPGKGGGRARGVPRLRRARQGVDHARKRAGKTGDPARGKPRSPDGDGGPDRRSPRRPRASLPAAPRTRPLFPRIAPATRPSPGRTQAVAAPNASSGLRRMRSIQPAGTAQASPRVPAVTGRAAVDELPGMRPIYMFISDLPGSGCENRCTSRYWGFPSSWRRVPSA